MTAQARRPGFLAAVSDGADPRTPGFAGAHGTRGIPSRPAPRAGPGPAARNEPAGPTAEEAAALRAEAMEKVAHAVEVLRLQGERLSEQVRSDALEIGFLVARRILEAELSTSPDALFSLVRSAVRKAGESRRVVVRVHPEHLTLVEGAVASGEAGVSAARVEVAADGGLEPGDCVVETDFGTVDGRLRTRLEELFRAARTSLEEGSA